jgi:L-lactate utilization protein LutC
VTARAEFMDRIRREMAKTLGLFPARGAERPAEPVVAAEVLRRRLAERWPQALERFRQEFERLSGVFYTVDSMSEVPAVVGRIARERNARRVITWSGKALGVDLGDGLRGEGLDPVAMPDEPVDADEAPRLREINAAAEIGVTGADLAVGETGTLVRGTPPDVEGLARAFLRYLRDGEARAKQGQAARARVERAFDGAEHGRRIQAEIAGAAGA